MMPRYKRYKRRVNRTNFVKMKFQSFVDIATQADNMQIISVNAGGEDVIRRLSPFFQAYKYYKLGGVSIKLIPASTLPVDPTGLSYAEDDFQTVDPRDQLTPGMCRITNGEDILEDLTGLSGDDQRKLYNTMLLDPRWFKWMLQTGVKRFGKPRYWQIGQLHQDKWPGAVINYPAVSGSGGLVGTDSVNTSTIRNGNFITRGDSISSSDGIFQTGHRGVLGWMPTDSLQTIVYESGKVKDVPTLASVPTVELFKLITPPMYKTNYYYRMFITETVYFKDPIVMAVNGFRPLDVFHTASLGIKYEPRSPSSDDLITDDPLPDWYTGGNDGSN